MPDTTITQRCSRCKIFKPFTEFHKSSNQKNGIANNCKTCESIRGKTLNRRNGNRKALKRYRDSIHGKAKRAEYRRTEKGLAAGKRYYYNNQSKQQAKNKVNHAVANGDIPRIKTQQCTMCGKTAQEYHHHKGYSKEHHLAVLPYCSKCHKIVHSCIHTLIT